ncbi:MAG: hypothetical protein IFK94_10460 [Acidobacteria bacterium]|uniref:Uncharacterized protein n=1 Tax=Candidatus Polarisedimenticola svalbardensis TaxID=2886004 RepID=A0A8J7CLT2_9BACT|nr:hypothetical protein [Candidatus Polarisedimenticola svalbardensis]
MNTKLLWVFAVVLTLFSAVYQRMTGPTYPVRVAAEIAGQAVSAKLLTSHSVSTDLPVTVTAADESITGKVVFRRLGSGDDWTAVPMNRDGEQLTASLPKQLSAGKLEYSVMLESGGEQLQLSGVEAVVARFKGDVPAAVLIPHIFLMFFAMVWANRAALEALVKGNNLVRQSTWALLLLVVGGLILGPIVQKYAFGAYWTGWPFGGDLTDNKLAVAVLAWAFAAWRVRTGSRWPAVVAAIILLAMYMIPHSALGSTLDYETMQTVTG